MMVMVLTSALAVAMLQAPKLEIGVTSKVGKGGVVTGSVSVKIPDGWHAYQNPPKSEFENPLTLTSKTKGFKLTKVVYPKGIAAQSSGMDSLIYEGTIKISFEGKAEKSLKPVKGAFSADLEIGYQLCDASTCIPPTSAMAKLTWKPAK